MDKGLDERREDSGKGKISEVILKCSDRCYICRGNDARGNGSEGALEEQ
jgi:hypothetical protein